MGGDASSGVHYATLGRTVIIPTGASSADIVFTPQVSTDTVDRTATIVLAPGAYLTGSQTNASVVIQNYTFPAGTNVWLGSGNASVAANWSLNRVPSASDNILLDSDSLGAMNWDAGVNGLSATVASWTQTADYTGAVTIDTRRGGAFSMFTITGNAVLNGGSWTHPYGDTVDTIGLRCTVGTNLTTGTGFTFDGLGRGYKNQSGPSGSGSISQGIAHGGEGGLASSGPGTIYGDYRAPVWRGSSATFTIGGTNGGGGAFYLVVGGAFLHNGHITVTGTATASYPAHSGGSIFIQAATLTGSGELNAKAAPGATTSKRAGGGGGRIAIRLTDAGATFATFTNGFTGPVSAAGSVCGKYLSTENHLPGASGTVYVETPGDNAKGTLVLDDAGIASDPTRDTLGAAVITTGGTGDLSRLILRSAGRLALSSNTTLRLPAPACIESDGQAMNAIRLDDTGALIFTSTDTTLDASAYSILANGTSHYAGSIRVSSPRTLTVTGMFSVNGLTLDGVRVAPGTYAASSLGSRVAGAGSIQVLGFKFGTAVLVR